MIRIANYEVALTTLANEGAVIPIVALSFDWGQLGRPIGEGWGAENSSLEITQDGLLATLDGQAVLFPLSNPHDQTDPENPTIGGVDRDQMLGLISEHGQLFVCGFDDQGDMVASIAFDQK